MIAPQNASSSGAVADVRELTHLLELQRNGQPLPMDERRFPTSMLEDMRVPVLAIPSRLFYAFEEGIEGFHEQREQSNLHAEARLFATHILPKISDGSSQVLHFVDVGAGDGGRGRAITDAAKERGFSVRYTCYDGSSLMIGRNESTFSDCHVRWSAVKGRFEDFRNASILLKEDEINILLFLGNNYGNYDPEDIAEMLLHKQMRPRDLLLIGTDIPNDDHDGMFVLREFLKYSNDRMRMGVFRQLGLDREALRDFVQYNPDRHQVEVYCVVAQVPVHLSPTLDVRIGDVFLANVARRPTAAMLSAELSRHFVVEVFKNRDADPLLALAVCRRRS